MSKQKKEARAARKAAREEAQGRKVIQWIAAALAVLFLLSFLALYV